MNHWNYRVMKRKNDQEQFDFGIYEVYYDDKGKVVSYTEDSLSPECDSEEDLKKELMIMMRAFDQETLAYKET